MFIIVMITRNVVEIDMLIVKVIVILVQLHTLFFAVTEEFN